MKKPIQSISLLLVFLSLLNTSNAQKDTGMQQFVSQIPFRFIGPATTSGRIVDIAVNPKNHSEYYVASAYGGVWKTENSGTTYEPIFDKYGTLSIGCLAIDPVNPNRVWVGTGENNNQRSVGYGNGIYLSEDGGKTFKNMGLRESYSVGMITINQENTNEIWVAAYGNVWGKGGDRGIYHTVDCGKTWEKAFSVSENTGFNEIHIDPYNSKILYAAAHQRRRHEFTYLGGGPESALYKSVDNGKTWNKVGNGFPSGDLGRISIECSETKEGNIIAIIEAEGKKGGVYKSTDYGASWNKTNDYQTSGNYYQEVYADPKNGNRLFFMDTYLHFSEDGGKTISRFSEKFKHVDNHTIWIDPNDYKHLLVGCDGGLYETFDYGENWNFKENIPVTQFYRVSVDNSHPFYHVYGGTQDNYSLGGPSRNNTDNGITNEEWYVTVGGDGFKSQIDPKDSTIVYSQWQYGGLIRYNRTTGEAVDIKPSISRKEKPLRWNWDAPLLISKYDNNKLYFAANRVFASNDKGNSWNVISKDLSRSVDRNEFPVMGKIWGLDAVAKNKSTSIYGNITYLVEGKKGQLVAGTDDGLIYITEDDGENWELIGNGTYKDVPNWVEQIELKSKKNAEFEIYPFVSGIQINTKNEIFAVLDHHRQGIFDAFVVKYTNGKWERIGKGIPENQPAKSILIDPIDEDIITVGTEFGLYISVDGGVHFHKFMKGLPPVAIKDIVYQEREDDLVLATFGRGFLVCDDYGLIREYKKSKSNTIADNTHKLFIPYNKLGRAGNGFKGASRFRGDNLDEKLTLRYFIDNDITDIEKRRKKRENEAKGQDFIYPSMDSIRAESTEIKNKYYISIYSLEDPENIVSQIEITPSKGWNSAKWDVCYEFAALSSEGELANKLKGPYVNEGKYIWKVISISHNGVLRNHTSIDTIEIKYLYQQNHRSIQENVARIDNLKKLNSSRKDLLLISNGLEDLFNKTTRVIENQVWNSNNVEVYNKIVSIQKSINDILTQINGSDPVGKYEFETHSSMKMDVLKVYWEMKGSMEAPTLTHMNVVDEVNRYVKTFIAKYDNLNDEWKSINNKLKLIEN